MQPETKIGLALGMILFGFFLAIGVRLTAEPEAPELRHPEMLEAEMTRHPLPLAPIPPVKSTSEKSEELVDFAKSSLIYQGDQFAPNPIRPEVPQVAAAADQAASGKSKIAEKGLEKKSDATNGGPVYHTVGQGETLSSIAAKHLGATSRYQEIFEMNRDQLASPDTLQVGMKLVVKPGVDAGVIAAAKSEAMVDEKVAAAVEEKMGAGKKEPVKPVEQVVHVDDEEKKTSVTRNRFSPAQQSPFVPKPIKP